MLAVEVRLLAGRFGASTYNDRTVAEWPPHPGRLFSALVHAWGDADEPDPQERADLVWLEEQAPPEIACSDAGEVLHRGVVTVYVPGNDPSAVGKVAERAKKSAARDEAAAQHRRESTARTARALEKAAAAYRAAVVAGASADPRTPVAELEVLPEHRNRQPRHFPVVRPEHPVVTFTWPVAEPDRARLDRLDGLLARIGRLGHSTTPVACRVRNGDPPAARLVPTERGDRLLRVPRSGLLDRLEREFARHQGRGERRMPAALAQYGPPRTARRDLPAGVLAGEWTVLAIETPIRLQRSLELTRAVRDALAAASPAAETYLTGRFPDGVARPHVAVVPLADVGHRWATGLVRGVALVLPREIDPADRVLVDDAVGRWQDAGAALRLSDGLAVAVGDVQIAVPGDEPAALWSDLPHALRRSLWCRPAKRWVSVTPVALDRHLPDASPSAAADLIGDACRHAGLPAPVEVAVSPTSTIGGVPRASGRDHRRSFSPFVAAGSGRVRRSVHVTVAFPEEVRGPVLLGAGRYLGRGLFLPVVDVEVTA